MTTKSKAHHKLTIADRRAKIAACLINQKMTLREAATECKCSLGTVSKDFNNLRAEWARDAADLIDLERRRTLADLERISKICWHTLEDDLDVSSMTAGQAGSTLLKALELKARVLGLFSEVPTVSMTGTILLPPQDPLTGGIGLKQIHGGMPE